MAALAAREDRAYTRYQSAFAPSIARTRPNATARRRTRPVAPQIFVRTRRSGKDSSRPARRKRDADQTKGDGRMADEITPAEFFEKVVPEGFAADPDSASQEDATLVYVVTGDGGGEWTLK